MVSRKGFTLIEVLTVLGIVGILIAVALPNFITIIEQTRAQTAQNNFFAIAAAESKYYEDSNGSYCVGACAASGSALNANLHLTMTTNDAFFINYACTAAGSSYTCTTNDGTDTLTYNPIAQPPDSTACPLASYVCAGPAAPGNFSCCPVSCTDNGSGTNCPSNLQ